MIADYNIPVEKVHYLPFGIDTDIFKPGPNEIPGNQTVIKVFSNRGFFPVYDSVTLVEGFSIAFRKDQRLRLILKGDGPEENKVKKLVESLKISNAVTFKEKTAYSTVPSDYQNIDIFITTSVSDGTPVSLLEAMATGLPCIASSVGGIPEWIADGQNGLLITPRSPQRVAEKLLLLTKNRDFAKELGSAARATILERGQWNEIMAEAEKDYEGLIKTYRQEGS